MFSGPQFFLLHFHPDVEIHSPAYPSHPPDLPLLMVNVQLNMFCLWSSNFAFHDVLSSDLSDVV